MGENKLQVVGMGALNLDILIKLPRFPDPDQEIQILEYAQAPGGSAANTIYGLAKLGHKAGFVGILGCDPESQLILEDFNQFKIDISRIKFHPQIPTGRAFCISDPTGDRRILLLPGANDSLTIQDRDLDYLNSAELVHFSSFVSDSVFQLQIEIASQLESKLSLDPGMIYAAKGWDELKPLLKSVDIFLPSRREIEMITGLDYRRAARKLVEFGMEIVAVKLGSEGCYVTDGRSEIQIPSYKVKVVDATGAGDAFNAGFLHGFLSGEDLEECAKLGNLVASMCIQRMGCRAGLPDLKELERALEELG